MTDRRPISRLLAPALLTAWMLALPSEVGAQTVSCDELQPVPGRLGYGPRHDVDRCEGLYVSPVRGKSLDIVSLLKGSLRFDHGRHRHLRISLPNLVNLGESSVHVRARAIPLKTYYRMDALVPVGGTMSWPIHEVLEPSGLKAKDLGLYGWIASEDGRVFVPLAVAPESESPAAPSEAAVELLVRSSVELEKLLWRVSDGSGDGPGAWQNALPGRARAGQPIRVMLPAGEASVVRVEIAAKRPNVDQWSKMQFRMLRPDP